MNDQELRDLWAEEAPHSPTAFTVAELKDHGAEGTSLETKKFLERLLSERREEQVFRLSGLVVLIPLAVLVRLAAEHAGWLLPFLFALIGVVFVLLGRQLFAIRATTRALNETRSPELLAQKPRVGGYRLALAVALVPVAAGVSYVTWAQRNFHESAAAQAFRMTLNECLDPAVTDPAACERVLETQPMHPDALIQLSRLRSAAMCRETFRAARAMSDEGQAEQALSALASLGEECPQELISSAVLVAKELGGVTVAAREACLTAASTQQWGDALERCGAYARLACPGMPPAWRDTDQAFLAFANARGRLVPKSAAPWVCIDSPVLRALALERDPDRWLDRHSPPLRSAALALADGRLDEAKTLASAIDSDEAHALSRDVEVVRAWLYVDQPRIDGPAFREALAAEERLVNRVAATRMTRLREKIVQPVARGLYKEGLMHADLSEWRQACVVWRRAVALDRGNNDLLNSVTNVCTKRAEWALDEARSCEQLMAVLDFAVEGDGLREKVDERRLSANCPASLDLLLRAVQAQPENAEAWVALGRAYQGLGKKKDAIAAYRKSLQFEDSREIADQIYVLEGD